MEPGKQRPLLLRSQRELETAVEKCKLYADGRQGGVGKGVEVEELAETVLSNKTYQHS